MRRIALVAFTGFLTTLEVAAPANADCLQRTLLFDGVQRSYTLCISETLPGMPVLVLLDGSGGSGVRLAALWQDFAARKGIILIAPDALHNRAWSLRDDSPEFLHAIINDVQSRYSANRRHLYLFGQSGGAVYALTLAMLESRYFAAVAIHAGAWRSPREFAVISFAQRKIPVKIIVGSADKYFTATPINTTQAALKADGFPIEVEIVPGQHHGFTSEIAAATEDSAWRFLGAVDLPGNPIFVQYH